MNTILSEHEELKLLQLDIIFNILIHKYGAESLKHKLRFYEYIGYYSIDYDIKNKSLLKNTRHVFPPEEQVKLLIHMYEKTGNDIFRRILYYSSINFEYVVADKYKLNDKSFIDIENEFIEYLKKNLAGAYIVYFL